MTDVSISLFLSKAFYIIRDYAKKAYTRKQVINTLVEKLSSEYAIEIVNDSCVKVENEVFKIYSFKTWNSWDIKHIGQEKIIKITVCITENGRRIDYYVNKRYGNWETYTENNIPKNIMDLMNKNKIVYHETDKETGNTTMIYSFI